MSRSGFYDNGNYDQWASIRWQGAIKSAIRGKRGQAFFKEMLSALDAMPNKRLIADDLEAHGEVCAIGAVGKSRGIDMTKLDPEEYGQVAAAFGISEAMAREIVYMNDDWFDHKTPEQRFEEIRTWVVSLIKP